MLLKQELGITQSYLKHAHSVRVTKDLVGLLLVCISYIRDCYEKLERIFFICLTNSTLDLSSNFSLTFLAVTIVGTGRIRIINYRNMDQAAYKIERMTCLLKPNSFL